MKSTSTDDEEPPERSAGFVLYAVVEGKERRYVLLRHRNGGHWGFPKGRIELGEEEVQAALRETKEETGIQRIMPVPGFRAVSTYRFFRNGIPFIKEVVYFLGRIDPCDIHLSEEHVEWQWLTYPDAQKTLTYAEARNVLLAAEQYLKQRQTVKT